MRFPLNLESPAFVLESRLLRQNLELIQAVQEAAGVNIILALKGFAMWRVFPTIAKYLKGATASSLNEARLIYEEMGRKAHTYAVAYIPDEFQEIMRYSSHITFNSVGQYRRFKPQVDTWPEKISCGIRVNPEYSTVEVELYNPAAPGSRLGEVDANFKEGLEKRFLEGLEGIHFHTLCESSSYDLEKTLEAFEARFGQYLGQLKWVNMGGGHLMTRKGYDTAHLIAILKAFKQRYPHLEVILEPGSAIAWETGFLLATVLDIHESRGVKTAIMDISFTGHMPDTLEMPYRPRIRGATDPVVGQPAYRIGGVSCLSGDYMYEYSFDHELQLGEQLIFEDMIHYTMVKTTMFNGVRHPDICILKEDGTIELVRRFGYEDYKGRLG
ncbi:MAG: carboxynorspermidine decarboxylase [Saprospirales bacterium]|nr:carboxynorspermidine decarboxylase [Saprospirales bacterium]